MDGCTCVIKGKKRKNKICIRETRFKLLSVSLINIVAKLPTHSKVFPWQMKLVLIRSDYACPPSSSACRGSGKRNFMSVSTHFCLKDTRWHKQIKLEACIYHMVLTCQGKDALSHPCTVQSTSAAEPESHTWLIILEMPPLLNVGFSHSCHSLQALLIKHGVT